MRIKCLSLWQPWASLMAIGAKSVETRGAHAQRWGLQAGELVGIAATASWERDVSEWLRGRRDPNSGPVADLIESTLQAAGYRSVFDLPLGCVLSVHRFEGCHRTEGLTPDHQEEAFGDYGPGRLGLLLPRVLRLPEPIPAKGRQGVWWWDVPAVVATELEGIAG